MGLLSRIRDRFARNDTSVVAGLFPKWQANKPLWGIGDYRLLADEGYRRNVVIYSCVRTISDSTAEPRVTVKQWKPTGKFEDVSPDHPLITLITEPNPDQSWFEFAEQLVTHLEVSGNAYVHKIRSKAGRVVQIYMLRPDRMRVVPDSFGRILGYEFGFNEGAKTLLPAEDVVQLKLPDPLDDFYGLSPIAVCAGIADMDTNSVDYLRAFFLNSGEPSGIIKVKGRTEPEQRQRLKEMWREQHGMGARTTGWVDGFRRMFGGGAGGWHSPTVMDEDVDYQEIGSRPGKLGLDNIFGITETRICGAFGVPPIVAGALIGLRYGTYSNYETALKAMWQQTLRPMYSRMADKLTMGLAREFGPALRIHFDLENVQALTESANTRRIFAIDSYQAGLLTQNEARALVAHDPVDGGNIFKQATGPFLPTGAGQQQQGFGNSIARLFFRRALRSNGNGNGNGHGHRHALPAPFEVHDQPTEPAWRVLHRIADAAVPEVKASFLAAVAKLVNGKVLREVEKAIADGDLDAATDAIPWDTVAFSKLGATLTEQLQSIATDAGIAAEKIQPPNLDLAFDRTNPLAAKWASERSGELIKGLSDESRAAVRGYISDALGKGIAIPDVADQLRDVIGLTERDANAVASMRAQLGTDETLNPLEVDRQVSNYADDLLDGRATMIARQETLMAANRGQELLWDQAVDAGLIDTATTTRQWIATPDERECPLCEAMDGVEVGLGESWQTENGAVSTPQEIHPQCRCAEGLSISGGE